MLAEEVLLQWFDIMIPYIPSPYQFIAKIVLAFLAVVSLAFAWHRFVAEPYREQGRAELRTESMGKSLEIIAWQASSNSLVESIENQNKLVQEYKTATLIAQTKTAAAIKKSQVIQEAKQAILNKAQNSRIKLKSCDDEVALAKKQLETSK